MRILNTKRTVLAVLAAGSMALNAGSWKSAAPDSRHTLTYSATQELLGSATPVTVEFQCDPKSGNQVFGTLGFDLTVGKTSGLKAFPFDDFEGPDAKAPATVHAVLSREGMPALTFKSQASGSVPDDNAFCFSVAELSKQKKSVPKSLLQALAEPGAESLLITVSDPRNPKPALQVVVPVAGRHADFQALISGLK